MTNDEIVAGIESGRIPVAYLFRAVEQDGRGHYWEWLDKAKPANRAWTREDGFPECCGKLLEQSSLEQSRG